MAPLRKIRRRSGTSSRRRDLDNAVQRAVERLLPMIVQTVNHSTTPPPPPPPTPPLSTPTPPPSPPPLPPPVSSSGNLTVDNSATNPPADIYTWLARFQKQKPRSFSSATTPVEAQNWITHVEKIFEVMGVSDEFKTRLATYKLEDDAQGWWGTVKHARGGDSFAATLSWNDFKELFYQQYFSSARRSEYVREYASIKQREDEPMVEFMARFTRLASFMGPAAGTPSEQADKLKWAVCEKFKWLIINQEFKDITEVANAVQNLEIANKDMKVQFDDNLKKNHTSSTGDRKPQFNQNNSNQNRVWQQAHQDPKNSHHPYQTSQKFPPHNQATPRCDTCGKLHKGICLRASGSCFKCGQAGHKVKDCPKSKEHIGSTTAPNSVIPPTTGGRVFTLTTNNAPTEEELAKKRLKYHDLLG